MKKSAFGQKLLITILIAAFILLLVPLVPPAEAVADATTANDLYALGLFRGVGDNKDGTPNFALDRVPTRHEAITMLVRLLGKEDEAQSGTWTTPFTDVADWAKPYVGYAYTAGLTTGTSDTTFGGFETVTASQYITFVLRALGYSSGGDFQWDKAWELSDELGFTNGEYSSAVRDFTRGDVAEISFNALTATQKDSGKMLYEDLIESGAIARDAAADLITPPLYINNTKVVSVQSYYKMLMGGVRSECKSNTLINTLYQFLQNNSGQEVAAPESFGSFFNLDASYYYMNSEISFMETSGLEGSVLQQYVIYSWLNTYPDTPAPLGSWLINDVTHDKWYQFNAEDTQSELGKIFELGSWVEIYNNVA